MGGYNIKMYLKEIGREIVEWIYLAEDRDQWRGLVDMVMILRVPQAG
jgi:competence CoiA-like predicted nuclease